MFSVFNSLSQKRDTVCVNRSEMQLFAQKSILLKVYMQNEIILKNQIRECEYLSEQLRLDIEKKNLIISNDSTIIQNQNAQIENLNSENNRLIDNRKILRLSFFSALGIAIVETIILITK